jgi:SulP family sulfate permease
MITLTLLSGIMLVVLSFIKFGFLSNYLSKPVLTAFIFSSAILIVVNQSSYILGINVRGDNIFDLIRSMNVGFDEINRYTLLLGVGLMGCLIIAKHESTGRWLRQCVGGVQKI